MLPKCVLCAPNRGGRQHRKATAAYTLDRLHRWQEVERLSLWESGTALKRGPGLLELEQRKALAIGLAREGFDRKACAALLSKGLCPPTAATAEALRALHPQQPPPTAVVMNDLPVAREIAPSRDASGLLPSETAPGPSGLRVQHLMDANVAGGSDAFLSKLTAVVNLLAQGRAPEFLAGAGLVALPKPQGGVRPIAAGETPRRLTGKCLMGRNDAQSFFWPAQVGVAVPGGAEKAIHTVRAWHRRHQTSSDKVALKLDFANAFNTVRRDAVLSAIRDPFPALARWATWCYQRPTRLQFDEWVVESCAGVQQGDPLGPLLFAAAL